jgi:hypothetical protein
MIEADALGKFFQTFVGCGLEYAAARWCRQLSKTRCLLLKLWQRPWEMIVGKQTLPCQLANTLECLENKQNTLLIAQKFYSRELECRFVQKIVKTLAKRPFWLNRNF